MGEIPHLQAAVSRSKEKNKPFEILAVSVDEERSALVDLIAAKKNPGIQTWDEKGPENPIAELYNVHGLPTWYLIDPKGIIKARDPSHEELIAAIEASVDAEKAKPKETSPDKEADVPRKP